MRREAALMADKVLHLKKQIKQVENRLLPRIDQLLRIDLEYVKRTLEEQYK